MAVNVEVKVFILHLLVLAVGADFGDGGVEFVCQLFVTLAHGDTGAAAEVLGVFIGRADKSEALARFGLQETVVEVDRVVWTNAVNGGSGGAAIRLAREGGLEND